MVTAARWYSAKPERDRLAHPALLDRRKQLRPHLLSPQIEIKLRVPSPLLSGGFKLVIVNR